MILQKLLRTFKAMFVGWVVFCAGFSALSFADVLIGGGGLRDAVFIPAFAAIFSIPVVLIAWLTILFPVDCFVPDRSKLREPLLAGLIGFVVGPIPFIIIGTYQQVTSFEAWLREVARNAQDTGTWVYLGGAAITGFAAALHLAFKHPPTRETHLTNPVKP